LWITSFNLVGLRCIGSHSHRYWERLNASIPLSMPSITHMSLDLNSLTVSTNVTDFFDAAMAKLSRSVRRLSLDLKGFEKRIAFSLAIVQRRFEDVQSMHLINLGYEAQGLALDVQRWVCSRRLEELEVHASVISVKALSQFIASSPQLASLVLCRCSNLDELGSRARINLPRGHKFKRLNVTTSLW